MTTVEDNKDGMKYCRRGGGKWFFFIPVIIAAVLFIGGYIIMLLWNSIMPDVFHLGTITYWQAIGIFILAKILFGSFGKKGCGYGRGYRRHFWKEKWMNMTDEEKAKFKEEWKNRCSSGPPC